MNSMTLLGVSLNDFRLFLHISFFPMIGFGCGQPLNVEIISTIPYDLKLGIDLTFTGAALQVSGEDIRRRYSDDLNVSLTMLYNRDDHGCSESDPTQPILLAEYFNRFAFNRCVVLVATACGGLTAASYLAREWDVLLLTNAVGYDAVFDPVSNPTSVSMAGTYDGLASAVLKLLRVFQFHHVTVLLADYVAVSEWYTFNGNSMMDVPWSHDGFGDFSVEIFKFQPDDRELIIKVLQLAVARSRVIYILAHSLIVLDLLRIARDNHIISSFEEYIILVLQPVPNADYGAPSVFSKPSLEDKPLFQSVIYLTTAGLNKNGSERENLDLSLRQRQTNDYGFILEAGVQPLDLYLIRETYNEVQVAAQIVNESRSSSLEDSPVQQCSGRRLRRLLAARKFTFPSGDEDFDADGSRNLNLLAYTFAVDAAELQISARYMSSSGSWETTGTIEWLAGKPPADVPLCGYNGLEGPCRQQAIERTTIILAVTLTGLFLLPTFVGIALYFRWKYADTKNPWWRLQDTHWCLGPSRKT